MDIKRPKTPPTKYDTGRTMATYRPGTSKPGQRPNPTLPIQPQKKAFGWKKAIIITAIGILGLIIFVGVWDSINISRASHKMFGSSSIFSLINSSGLQTDPATGRVNVLIAGNSADDPGHAGANLTDTILLLSMNPSTHTGYMLSIPRDLYVAIPGYYGAKINSVYSDGGMALLQQVVEKDFGVKISYWALVDYTAVRQIVDAVGGINVSINSPDGRLYDPNKDWSTNGPLVDLTNGTHHLDGQQALDFSRARGDPSQYGTPIGFEQSDFQRTADQRQVFAAIKTKLNWTLILNPLKNGQILSAIANNVQTNIPADQARPLFGLFNKIPSDKLQSLSLRDLNGKNYLVGTYYDGSTQSPAAGLYDFSEIDAALNQLNK